MNCPRHIGLISLTLARTGPDFLASTQHVFVGILLIGAEVILNIGIGVKTSTSTVCLIARFELTVIVLHAVRRTNHRTVCRIIKDRSALIGNSIDTAGGAGGHAAAKALGMVIGDQHIHDVKCAIRLNHDAAAAPVFRGHGRVVRDVYGAAGGAGDNALCAARDSDAAALAILSIVACNSAATHNESGSNVITMPKTSIYAAAGFFRIVTGDIAAGHIHLHFLKRNAAAAVLTIRIISTTVLAVVGHVAVRHADGTAFHIDTAAIAVVATIDPVTRNCTAMEVQHAGIHVDTAAVAI